MVINQVVTMSPSANKTRSMIDFIEDMANKSGMTTNETTEKLSIIGTKRNNRK